MYIFGAFFPLPVASVTAFGFFCAKTKMVNNKNEIERIVFFIVNDYENDEYKLKTNNLLSNI